jgi:hypothetical protein
VSSRSGVVYCEAGKEEGTMMQLGLMTVVLVIAAVAPILLLCFVSAVDADGL